MSKERLAPVGKWSIKELLSNNLKIPDYQRPYSWEKDQVEDLINDLINAYKDAKQLYLIGNIILNKPQPKDDPQPLEIVDGQQRITTLSLILKVLDYNDDNDFLNNKINSLSAKRLQENYWIINNRLSNFKDDKFRAFILDKAMVTYIKTESQDEAFLLFDSQNTRGKSLARKDLLKVHHIREMKITDYQKTIIKKWEIIEKSNEYIDILEYILKDLLALNRIAIRGELDIHSLSNIDVYKEFKSEGDYDNLNNYNQPAIFNSYDYKLDRDQMHLATKAINFSSSYTVENALEYLPIEIPQSVEGGEKFFYYAFKYYQAYERLNENSLFTVLDSLNGIGNSYLRKIYKSSLFLYYDKFQWNGFEEFSLRVYILLFYFRVVMSSIRKEGVVSFQWNKKTKLDFYKLIFLKYAPSHIIRELDTYIEFELGNMISIKGKEKPIKEIVDDSPSKKQFWNKMKDFKSNINEILEGKREWELVK